MFFFTAGPGHAQQRVGSLDYAETEEIRVNNVTLNYFDQGDGDPVVFVHGTLGDYRTWESQVEAFAKEYRVISYSRRYHHPNPWPGETEGYSVTVHAEDLVAFIQALELEKVHLVGHSFGAFAALLAARDHPELVRSVTLGEPPVMPLLSRSAQGHAILQSFMENSIIPAREAFNRGDDAEGVRRFVNGVLGEGEYEELPSHVRGAMMQNARELEGETKEKELFPPFTCKDGREMYVPALLLDGEASPEMFGLINDTLEQCIPDNERAMIPQASHGLQYENPQAFNEIVMSFLDKH